MVLAINWDSLKLMGKYAIFMVGLLLIVYILAKITPWVAGKIDKIRENPERVQKNKGLYSFDDDEVKSIYDAQINEDKKENGDDFDNGKE